MKKKGILFIISGPSGVGKGELCKNLLKDNQQIQVSVSATTRHPRTGEVDGVNYFFMTKEKFETLLEEDAFLEYAKVYDNYYGTPKKYTMESLNEGKDIILEIDIVGATKIKEKIPEGVFIFILPPSLNELKNRIVGRGTESESDIAKRHGSAKEEIKQVKKYDYAVINDDLQSAAKDIEAIIRAERCKVNRIYPDIQWTFFKEEK
jgi:guanylate kinase